MSLNSRLRLSHGKRTLTAINVKWARLTRCIGLAGKVNWLALRSWLATRPVRIRMASRVLRLYPSVNPPVRLHGTLQKDTARQLSVLAETPANKVAVVVNCGDLDSFSKGWVYTDDAIRLSKDETFCLDVTGYRWSRCERDETPDLHSPFKKRESALVHQRRLYHSMARKYEVAFFLLAISSRSGPAITRIRTIYGRSIPSCESSAAAHSRVLQRLDFAYDRITLMIFLLASCVGPLRSPGAYGIFD